MKRIVDLLLHGSLLVVFAVGMVATSAQTVGSQTAQRALKVVIISMFAPEAEPWIAPFNLNEEIAVPGLSPDYPTIKCSADDVCLMTAGMGHASLGSVDWPLLLKLLAGSLPGIWVGSHLMGRINERVIRSILSILLAWAGVKLIAI